MPSYTTQLATFICLVSDCVLSLTAKLQPFAKGKD